MVDIDPDGGNHQTAAPAERGDEGGLTRADALEPSAPERGRSAEQNEEQGEHPAEVELGPVAIRGEERVASDGNLAPEGGRIAWTRDRLAEALRNADRPSGSQNTLKP